MRPNAVQDICLLVRRQGQLLQDGDGEMGAFFSMAHGPVGFILETAADVMQVSRHQQNVHIHSFDGADAFTQPANPKGVLPVVAASGTLKVWARHLFYCGQHGETL